MVVKQKEWDSNLFGIRVGEVEVEPGQQITVDQLLNAGAGNVDLIYIFSTAPIESPKALFTDCKVELIHSVRGKMDFGLPLHIRSFQDEAVLPQLLALAKQSGEYSRFKLDPRMPNSYFDKLYETWLSKSISKAIADEVLVAWDDAGNLHGFVTLALKDQFCEIGLLAVDLAARGKGIGKQLMEASRQFAGANGLTQLRVATQQRNAGAVGFYQACGFEVFKETYIAHFWTNKS